MSLDILGNPFASEAQVGLDENVIRSSAPSLPDTKVQDLIRAADGEQWDRQEGVNEKFILDKKIASIATNVSAELGPFALNMYEDAQDMLSAGVLRLINEGDRTGSFRGQNARGGSQWDAGQIDVSALEDTDNLDLSSNDDEYLQNTQGARVYSTGGTGDFNVAPKFDTTTGSSTASLQVSDTTANGVGTDSGAYSPDTDTQAVFILGYYSSTNPRAIEQAQLSVDDGVDRTPFDVYGHQNLGTLQAQEAVSFEYLTDDDSFDLNGSATQDVTTDFYPFGVNVNTASRLGGLDTQI